MWPRLQNQPVQTLYWLVNQFVPPEDWKHGSRPGNTLVVQFDGEAVSCAGRATELTETQPSELSEPSEPARRVPRALGRRMCWVRLALPRARPC